jgi:hypothetical protein
LPDWSNTITGGAATQHRAGVLLGGALALIERARSLHDPDAIEAIGPDPGNLAEEPVVRQRLRPERINLKLRHRVFLAGFLGKSRT